MFLCTDTIIKIFKIDPTASKKICVWYFIIYQNNLISDLNASFYWDNSCEILLLLSVQLYLYHVLKSNIKKKRKEK